MTYWPTRRPLTIFMMLALVLPLLAACGGDTDEFSHAGNQLAAVTATPPEGAATAENEFTTVATEPATPDESAGQRDDPPVTLVSADSGDAPSDSGASGQVPDNPWGKEIPTGPAPTVPPNPPSDFDKDGDGMYTGEELAEAIRYRFPEYEWPANYQMTADIIIENLHLEKWPGSGWEAPGEYTIIGGYYSCAWEHALLDAVHENDQPLVDESLHQLKDIALTKNPLSRDEEGKAMMRSFYNRAALGDPADLQQWVDNNCSLRKKNFIAPDAGTPVASTSSGPGLMDAWRTFPA